MAWFKEASKYKLIYNGKKLLLDDGQIASIIKDILKNSVPVRNMFNKFKISIDKLDDLIIEIISLDKKYALTDAKKMKINKALLEHEDFFEKYRFVFFHEIVHFLTRIKEKRAFFNDDEEVEALVMSLANELERGTSYQDIWKKLFHTVDWHFSSEEDAEAFFARSIN
ncbi:MAG: hypothetical protein WC755_01890, partial [Candidatus Woesearchaeota archaeon]